jgi:hypothetical protein
MRLSLGRNGESGLSSVGLLERDLLTGIVKQRAISVRMIKELET